MDSISIDPMNSSGYNSNRKYNTHIRHSLIWTFMVAFVMCLAMPDYAEAARKKTTKSKTTTTTRKKSTRKRYKTRRAGSSSSGGNWKLGATDVNPNSQSPEMKKKTSKRQITVMRPDIEEIRKVTLDPANKMYFPKLMKKFNRNDTIMTADEYRHLYLGYMFQEDYDPYRESKYTAITDSFRDKTSHTKEEIDTIRKYAELALRDNPFDLRQMSFLVHVLKERRKDMSAKIWEYRLEHLLGAIKSTGTGEDEDNAWFVIYPAHEYDMVQLMGYRAVDVDLVSSGYDYIVVEPEEETARRLRDKVKKGFYFDVRQIYEQYELKHPEEVEEDDEPVDPDDTPAEDESANPDDIPAS